MRVAIFGSNGFIGSHLSNYLSTKKSLDILCMVRENSDLSVLEKLKIKYLNNKLNYFIYNPNNLIDLFKDQKIDMIINLISYGVNQDHKNKKIAHKVNTEMPVALYKVASENNVKYFIHFGTSQEYGNEKYIKESIERKPISIYGKSKYEGCNACIEEYIKNKNCKLVILRPFSIYGECESEKKLIPSLINSIKKQTKLSLTEGLQDRNYLYVEDLIKYIYLVIGEISNLEFIDYNIGSAKNIKIKNIAKIISDITNMSENSLNWGAVSYRDGETMEFKADFNRIYGKVGKLDEHTMYDALQKINLFMDK